MGAIAEAIVAYAQPLIDQTDGSMEQMNKALAISQVCYNLALLSKDKQDLSISEMQPSLQMDDEEFDEFRRSVIIPMIRRHEEMFPQMHGNFRFDPSQFDLSPSAPQRQTAPAEKYPGTERYAPCPCNSGKKYKFCCGAKGR
jgi:uncharacterized protein YecA (UPF0149 family)